MTGYAWIGYTPWVHIFTSIYWLLTLLVGTVGLVMSSTRWIMTKSLDLKRMVVFLGAFYLIILAAFLRVLLQNDGIPWFVFNLPSIIGQILLAISLPRWLIGHQAPENPLPDLVQSLSISGLILLGVVCTSAFLGTPVVWTWVSDIASVFMVLAVIYANLLLIGPAPLRSRVINVTISLLFIIPIALDSLGILPGKDEFAPFGLRVVPLFYVTLNCLFIADFIRCYRAGRGPATPAIAPAVALQNLAVTVSMPTANKFALSPRETEVADMLAQFCSYKEICDRLNISLPTVKSHASNIYRKTGSGNRRELLKKLLIATVLVCLLVPSTVWGQQNSPDISVNDSSQAGRTRSMMLAHASGAKTYPYFQADVSALFTIGNSHEIVWTDSTSTTKLSELIWPIPASLGLKLGFNVAWAHWLETRVQLQGAAALGSGTMTDDDWNIYDSGNNLLSTVHSDSTAWLNTDWNARLEVAVPFHYPIFSWRILLGMDYQQYYWEAWNAVQIATKASDGSQTITNLTGQVSTFRQEWYVPYFGFGVNFQIGNFDIGAAFRFSPYMWVNQTDLHILREITFIDSLAGGYMIEPSLHGGYHLTSTTELILDLTYRYIDKPRGDDAAISDGASISTTSLFVNGAGASLENFSANLGLEFTF